MRSTVLSRMVGALALALALASLAACGGSAPSAGGTGGGTSATSGTTGGGASSGPATLADIPSYPEAKALKPGENQIADTLAQNMKQSAQMGQKLEQQMFTLPQDATWDKVKTFYTEKLTAAGWQPANLPAMPDNPMMQLSIWMKGTQNLTVGRMATDPAAKDAYLLFSLSSQ